jgi:carbon monoxide dehydrogenase subunit G
LNEKKEEAMATVAVSNEIAAPLDRVFQTFTDIEHGPAHVSGIKKLEMMTPGPIHVGTRWLETREVMGRLDTAEMEITAFERNRMYTITHHKVGLRIDTTFWFEPSGNGTKVTVEFDLDSGGFPPGLLAPLGWAIAGKVEKVLSHDLADLKRSVGG